MRIQALSNLTLYTIESTTTDKQDVMGVYMDIFLIRMFTSTLWRYVNDSALQQFEKPLLYTLSTDIARNRRIVALTGYLVYLVDKDNASLCGLDIIVGHLQQTGKNALNIFTDVTCLGKYRSVNNGKGYIEHLSDSTRQQGLSCTR